MRYLMPIMSWFKTRTYVPSPYIRASRRALDETGSHVFMWHVAMCVYVHVHVFMLYLDVLAYESMRCEGQRSRSGIFLSSFST